MSVDGPSLTRAARQLEQALTFVDGAQSMEVPLLFGRGASRDALRATLGDAHDWATSAALELEGSGPAVADARRAIEQLADGIDGIRWQRDVASARHGEAFRTTVDGARAWTNGLDRLGEGSVAINDDHAVDWFRSAITTGADRGNVQAAVALADDPRLDDLGAMGDMLRRMQVDDARSLELARVALDGDVPRASSMLLDDVVAASVDGAMVATADLRAGLAGLDHGAGDGARRLPAWLGHAGEQVQLDDIHRSQVAMLLELPDRAVLADEATRLLARPLGELDHQSTIRIAAIGSLPDHLRPPSIDGDAGAALAVALRAGDDGHEHVLRLWGRSIVDPSAAKAAGAELLATAAPTSDTARRLAVVAGYQPSAVFGRVGTVEWRESVRAELAATRDDSVAAVLVDAVRTARTSPRAAALAAEVDGLLALPELTPDAMRRLATLASLPDSVRSTSLSDARGALLDAVRTGFAGTLDELRWTIERASIVDGGEPSARVFDEIATLIGKADADVTVEDLRRLERLTTLGHEVGVDLPERATQYDYARIAESSWLPTVDADSKAEFAQLRNWVDTRHVNGDPAITRQSLLDDLHAITMKADGDVSITDMRRIALMDSVDAAKRPDLPGALDESRLALVRRGALPRDDDKARTELDSLRLWSQVQRIDADPSVTRETLLEELDRILAKADAEVDVPDLRFLAAIDRVGSSKRIELPGSATSYSRQRIADSGWLPNADTDARAEFGSLRLWRERDRFVTDATHTRESVIQMIDDILAKPDADITQLDMRRLALADALPADVRPEFPAAATQYSRERIAAAGWIPSSDSDARTEIASLRMWSERRKALDDPNLTRETLQERIASIVLKPDDQVTTADMAILALADEVPDHLRPGIPAAVTNYSRARIATSGWTPSNDADARAEVASLRRWASIETELGRTIARDKVLAGEPLDPMTLAALAGGGDELLERVGLDRANLLDAALDSLEGTGNPELTSLNAQLRLAQSLVDGLDGAGQLRQTADQASERFGRSIDRIDGLIRGGYSNFPDYAEIGEGVSLARIAAGMSRIASRSADHATPATPTAVPEGPTVERLTW